MQVEAVRSRGARDKARRRWAEAGDSWILRSLPVAGWGEGVFGVAATGQALPISLLLRVVAGLTLVARQARIALVAHALSCRCVAVAPSGAPNRTAAAGRVCKEKETGGH